MTPCAFSSGSRSPSTPVIAFTSAVLPWSICPEVPTIMCASPDCAIVASRRCRRKFSSCEFRIFQPCWAMVCKPFDWLLTMIVYSRWRKTSQTLFWQCCSFTAKFNLFGRSPLQRLSAYENQNMQSHICIKLTGFVVKDTCVNYKPFLYTKGARIIWR